MNIIWSFQHACKQTFPFRNGKISGFAMIKVFEDFDITLVGYYQSVLAAHDIETFMKNQFSTGGLGELPFVEVVPQLWVLNEAEVPRAMALLKELQDDS